MRYLIALLALACGSVLAADLTVTWTSPTQNTDGSSIPATGPGSLTSYRVQYGTCAGTAFGSPTGELTVNAPASSATVTNLGPGSYCVRVYARNTYSAESAASNVASKTIAAPTPRPPVLTTVDVTAYEPRRLLWWYTLSRVGTVPLGLSCDASVRLWSYYGVDRNAVTWSGYRQPQTVVARCG